MNRKEQKVNMRSLILEIMRMHAKKSVFRYGMHLAALVLIFLAVQEYLILFVEKLTRTQFICIGVPAAAALLAVYAVWLAWEARTRYWKFHYDYKILYMSGLREEKYFFWLTQYPMFLTAVFCLGWIYLSKDVVVLSMCINVVMALLVGLVYFTVQYGVFQSKFMGLLLPAPDFRLDVVCMEYALFNEWTVIENVALPLRIAKGLPKHLALNEAQRCIDALMLNRVTYMRCDTFSYFQKVEVKIARAYACTGEVWIAPELIAGMNEAEKKLIRVLLERITSDKMNVISKPFGQGI